MCCQERMALSSITELTFSMYILNLRAKTSQYHSMDRLVKMHDQAPLFSTKKEKWQAICIVHDTN